MQSDLRSTIECRMTSIRRDFFSLVSMNKYNYLILQLLQLYKIELLFVSTVMFMFHVLRSCVPLMLHVAADLIFSLALDGGRGFGVKSTNFVLARFKRAKH